MLLHLETSSTYCRQKYLKSSLNGYAIVCAALSWVYHYKMHFQWTSRSLMWEHLRPKTNNQHRRKYNAYLWKWEWIRNQRQNYCQCVWTFTIVRNLVWLFVSKKNETSLQTFVLPLCQFWRELFSESYSSRIKFKSNFTWTIISVNNQINLDRDINNLLNMMDFIARNK